MIYKRKVLKKWVRFSLLGIIIISFFSSGIIIYTGMPQKARGNKNIYSYKISQSPTYLVELYENSYINEKVIEENETYISDLIKNINLKFKYDYSGSLITPLTYDYNIIAYINGNYALENEKSKVWKKEFKLIENSDSIKDSTSIHIDESVNIDYAYYDEMVNKFKKELKLPIDASLSVILTVNIKGKLDGIDISNSQTQEIVIPLNQQALKIEKNYEKNINKNITNGVKDKKINYRKIISGSLLFLVTMFLFAYTFKDIFNMSKKNKYTSKLDKILKEYGDVIIEVINPVNEDNIEVIEVKNFNEMIDLEEELRVPIMFYETIEYYEGIFTLIHNNILYKYTLNND